MKKNYIKICFLALFCFSFGYSQISNEGVFEISASTDVYFENEYTNKTTGTHNNDGNLYLNNNFVNNGTTTSTSGTTYFKSASNPLLSISGLSNEINFYNLEVDVTATNTKGLSVNDGFALNVENAVNFTSGDIRLVGEAQLIQTHSGVDANTITSGKLLIDQQGYSSAYKFNYWSSPINNGGTFSLLGGKFDGTDSSINSFNPQQASFNSGSPYNGLPSVVDGSDNVITPLTINTYWLYQYMQGTGAYSDWVSLDENSTLNPGQGYTMKGTNTLLSEQNYVYYGAPNNGDYSFAINSGEQSLLGNPYPSALDSEKFINDNILLLDALYFWVDGGSTSHALTDYLGGYAIRNLTGGTPPSIASPLISGLGSSGSVTPPKQYVPVGQGFFVEAYGTGSIVFNNSQRAFKSEVVEESIFYSTTDSNQQESVKQYIRLGYEDPEGFHRQLLLGFLPNSPADINYNLGYDALLNRHREDDMFFIIDNDLTKKYAIQGLDDYQNTLEFPIGILISENGTHNIMIDALENFSDNVYLKDNVLNTTHNLTESSYSVNLPIGEYLDRFSIVFMPQSTLSNNDNDIENVKIYYDGNEHIIISNANRVELKSIKVFNVLGQEILALNKNLNNKTNISIPFSESDGVYIVQIETINNKHTQKILNY